MKRRKFKDNSLKKPSLFQREKITLLYNLILSAVFFGLFFGIYSIDELALEADYFLYYGFQDFRIELIPILVIGWFAFRQLFKDINFVYYTYLSSCHDEDIVKKGGYKRAYDGDEGTGKTTNVANDTLFIACAKDRAMRLAYYLKMPYAKELEDDVDFRVLKESFRYFERNGGYIPHFMTNFKVIYQGKENYPFSMDYLDQTRRLAEGFACGLSELGLHLPNAWSRMPADKSKDSNKLHVKNATLSLSRQLYDLTITADEQRIGEVMVQFRALVTLFKSLRERKHVLKPKFLHMILDLLENKVLKMGARAEFYQSLVEEGSASIKETCRLKRLLKKLKRLSSFYSKFNNFVRKIGFWKNIYDLRDANNNALIEEGLIFVTPCDLPFEFDTRGERKKYSIYEKSPS